MNAWIVAGLVVVALLGVAVALNRVVEDFLGSMEPGESDLECGEGDGNEEIAVDDAESRESGNRNG